MLMPHNLNLIINIYIISSTKRYNVCMVIKKFSTIKHVGKRMRSLITETPDLKTHEEANHQRFNYIS